MRWSPAAFALCCCSAMVGDAGADEYRCPAAPNVVRYQDKPCDTSVRETIPEIRRQRCVATDKLEPHAEATKTSAKRTIMASLKDPYSAIFEGMLYVRLECDNGLFHAVCARVNAKNSYGGYTGSDVFVYKIDEQGNGGLLSSADAPKAAAGKTLDADQLQKLLGRADQMMDVMDACTKAGRP